MRGLESDIESLLQKPKKSRKCGGKTIFLIIFGFLFGAALTNIDRIYRMFNSNDQHNINTTSFGVNTENMEEYDVVIVGGGAAGLANMHFLTMDDPSRKILLIEKLGRLGGRTQTYKLTYNNERTIQFEGGAMRFSPTNYYMNKMLHRVGLCSETWSRMDSLLNTGGNYYYRNYRAPRGILSADYYSVVYNFKNTDLTNMGSIRTLSSLNSPARSEIYNENNNGQSPQNSQQWEMFRNGSWTLRGAPVKQWNRKAFASAFGGYSEEWWSQYNDASGGNGYRSVGLYNGPNIFPGFTHGSITGVSSALHTIRGGYNMLVWKLAENITQHSVNNKIQLYSELVSIDESDDEYNYTVGIRNVTTDEIRYVKANKVILSLDQQSLKRVLPALRPINTKPVKDMVNSVVSGHCWKANFIYDSASIQELRQTVNSRTQLSIHYYMLESNWENGTLTTVHFYGCGESRARIAHLMQSVNKPYPYDKDLIKLDDNTEENILIMSQFLVDQIKMEMEEMLEIEIPYPIFASYHPLGMNESNGDGLSEWGQDSDRQFILSNDGITKPKKDEDIYVSVVDYSNSQGWVYGSIWSALKTVIQHFGIPDPLQFEPQCY